MNILYVGTNDVLFYLIMQHSEKTGDTFSKLPLNNKSLTQIRDEVISREQDLIVYDYTSFEDVDQKEFTATLIAISEAKNNDTIIYCPMGEGTKFVTSLRGVGFSKILTDSDENNLRESLERLLLMPKIKTSNNEMEKIAQNREEIAKEYSDIRSNIFDTATSGESSIKIGIAGSMQRIGSTAVALQLCKAINIKKSNSAGYIDVVGNYITNLKEHYFTEEIPNGISYGDISLYKDVISLKAEGFDYIIYDYSRITDGNLMSILDKDIVIIVGQAGPSEIEAFTPVMAQTKDCPVINYVFYGAPKSKEDRQEIINSMPGYEDKTFFIEHVNDPFVLDGANKVALYNILNSINNTDNKPKKKNILERVFS